MAHLSAKAVKQIEDIIAKYQDESWQKDFYINFSFDGTLARGGFFRLFFHQKTDIKVKYWTSQNRTKQKGSKTI